ncbi:MAG: adenosylcobalamin-dependent ribonucleoside-diphosphate reductase [Anaerolineaceae bacterium]|nr:adenosylcobalamin-dependent ribonucleoside-diphosphate reductase [Anaerolineaceae bacterium]
METIETLATPSVRPTPPLPVDLPDIDLTDNALKVLQKRYLRKDENGNPVEGVKEMFWRVAYHIAVVEEQWQDIDIIDLSRQYYSLLVEKRFFPNSPTFTGAGTPLGQLAACFVLEIADDMGKRSSGIFQTLRNAALIQQTGGGNGFAFSRLRPSGCLVNSSAGKATGPVGFLRVYDQAFGEVAQGGTRRGANMAVLRVDHPDIESFITCKGNEYAITNFNISVGITDAFMQAVENDEDWELIFPDVLDPAYKEFSGTLEQAREANIPLKVYKRIRARDLFNQIVKQAHHNGEPGMLFLDAANRQNPVPHLYQLEATNPCGEQWLGPYENCCLGSINLAQHLGKNGQVDWKKLQQSIELSVRFLDDVVDANKYVPSVPEIRAAAIRARRIGLGIMGLADLMYHTHVRYGSEKSFEFAGQVMEFVRYHAMLTSVALAKSRAAFPAIEGSIYDPHELTWDVPQPLSDYTHDFKRPKVDWNKVVDGIKQYGIRNAAQTTIAPTGTIATVTGCEGYGCEPVFALAYIRHVNDNGTDLQLTYTSPAFELALQQAGISEENQKQIIDKVMKAGSCRNVDELSADLRDVFVVSADTTAEEHVKMQAALQAFVDNSLSKTINFPSNATESDVADAYQLAWKLGCKGITVYVTGSRETVVLETHATAKEKQPALMAAEETKAQTPEEKEQMRLWVDSKKPRPRLLPGYTYSITTPLGKAFMTVNENGGQQPFEIFINTAKAGSETAAVSEAIGRLISYILRLSSPLEPSKRLRHIYRQLSGIGGGRSLGFGPNRVRSLPDGLAQVIDNYLLDREERLVNNNNGTHVLNNNGHVNEIALPLDPDQSKQFTIGDLCPECGEAAVINEEGCRKCYACAYSEC